MRDLDVLPGHYLLEVDVLNESESMRIITTEDFRIKNKENGNYLKQEEVRKIFPPNKKTGHFIDFARVRARISDAVPGEHLKLSAEFSVHTAKENSMFNVVSKCAYGNTPDIVKINEVWEEKENKYKAENMSQEDIDFHKKNFYILDAQKYSVEDSFDFSVQTVGVFNNEDIVKKAAMILHNKVIDFIKLLDSEMVPINISETVRENSYDVTLENEDYTIGKVLEYILYEKLFMGEKVLSFCGFKKMHPHNTDSIIRIAYSGSGDKNLVSKHLRIAAIEASEFFKTLYDMF
jgi:hypothetical protein